MNIIILTEGSKKLGFGHIYRMMAIYDYLVENGYDCQIVANCDESAKQILSDKNFQQINWLDKGELKTILKNIDIAIVDSYLADNEILLEIYNLIEVPVFIDDNNRVNYPGGFVVNVGIYAKELQYKENRKIDYLLGTNYSLLRKPFRKNSEKEIKAEIEKVFISLGGSDQIKLIVTILKILVEKKLNLRYNIIIGVDGIKYIEDNLHKIQLERIFFYESISAQKMREVMLSSDIAISASGQTLYELASVGVPTITICIADNQRKNFIYFNKYKITEKVDNISEIPNKINELSVEKRKIMSENGRNIINRNGLKMLMDDIISSKLHIRKANISDIDIIFHHSNEDYVRKFSIRKDKIDYQEHKKWFNEYINSERYCFFIIENGNGDYLGQVRYNLEPQPVISISLTKELLGKGKAKWVINIADKKLISEYNVEKIEAYIDEKNIASKKAFIRAGYIFKKVEVIENREFLRLEKKTDFGDSLKNTLKSNILWFNSNSDI